MDNPSQLRFTNNQLYRLILPLIIEQFLALAVGLADSIMVAQVGEAAVSAVSLVDSINILLINAFTALGAGGAVVCGQYIGRGNNTRASGAAVQLVVFMAAASCVVTAALYALRRPLMGALFGAVEADVMGHAATYYLIVEASIPFMALYSAGAAVFRVMGNSAVSMRVSLIMNAINLGGNALLVYALKWGVAGVAIPTLLSRLVGAVVVLVLLGQQGLPVHLPRPFRFTYDKENMRNIVRLGVPGAIEGSMFQLGKLLLVSVASAFGTAAITANAISNAVASFQVLAPGAVGVAMVTVVSQCVGAGDVPAARLYTKKLMRIAYISCWVCTLAQFALQPLILRVYNVSPEAQDMANRIIWMHGCMAMLFWPASFTFPNALKAAGDTRFMMWVASLSMWTFRVLFGIWFAQGLGFGVLGIWMSMFIDWWCRILFFILRWRGHRWESKAVR